MSMEAYALCKREIKSIKDWQSAINELKFGLELRAQGTMFDRRGHLPAVWRGSEAGFECRLFPFTALAKTYRNVDFGGKWPYVYAFYFHTLAGCVGTWFSIAACMKLTGGIAYDPQEARLLSEDDVVRYARDTEESFNKLSSIF